MTCAELALNCAMPPEKNSTKFSFFWATSQFKQRNATENVSNRSRTQ